MYPPLYKCNFCSRLGFNNILCFLININHMLPVCFNIILIRDLIGRVARY